eukprot:Lithocolla_globosa_v1_NODE_564_length_3732_cov_103.183302.p2 type:complete len:176 gc:universal NODE_564_length_3732_cov_103.183302:2285-1758(-)
MRFTREASKSALLLLVSTLLGSILPEDFSLKSQQETAVVSILEGKDVFAVLPTGYGKTFILVLALLTFNALRKHSRSTMILVAPTRGLMKKQRDLFEKIGLKTLYLGVVELTEKLRTDIENGVFQVIIGSAESFFSTSQNAASGIRFWKSVLSNDYYTSNLLLVGLDEAHCVEKW